VSLYQGESEKVRWKFEDGWDVSSFEKGNTCSLIAFYDSFSSVMFFLLHKYFGCQRWKRHEIDACF
jgi:hypothetical protein